MQPRLVRLCGLCALTAALAAPQPRPPADPMNPDAEGPRPIAARDSVFLQELTWMEVRDALRAGKTTVLIATGGIEQNGPYLSLDKHNLILRATTEAIARKLGNALVAPIVPFVPEGDFDPPSGHMKYPGSISLTEDTYQRLLADIATSMKVSGFGDIVLLGDSGGNQKGMRAVAETLSAKWKGGPTRIHYIPEYYDYPEVAQWLESQGIKQTPEGLHDDFAISTQIMTVDTDAVRMKERRAKGKLSINGVSLEPPASIEWGRKVVGYRAEKTAAAIRKATGR